MPQRYGPPNDVEPVRRELSYRLGQAQLRLSKGSRFKGCTIGQDLGGKSLVQLDPVHIFQRGTGPLQRQWRTVGRPQSHPRRRAATVSIGNNPAQRLQAKLGCLLLTGQQESDPSICNRAGIADGDRPQGPVKIGPELLQCLYGLPLAWTNIFANSLKLRACMKGNNLLGENPGGPGDTGTLVALKCKFILVPAGNGKLPGQVLCRVSHVQPAEGIREPLLDTDHRLEISGPETCQGGKLAGQGP